MRPVDVQTPAPARGARHRSRRSVATIALAVGLVLVAGAGVGAVLLRSSASGQAPAPGDRIAGPPLSSGATAPGTTSAGPSATGSPKATPSKTAGPVSSAAPKPGSSCAFTVSGGVCPIAPPAPAAAGRTWQVSFDEEFSGTSYDHNKLTACFDWNSGDCTSTFNNGREHYQPSQVAVSGGTAKLIAAPLSPPYSSSACQNGSCTYKAGLLSTARAQSSSSKYLYSFTYGYVESRFKFPATQGFFTAFWMLPADPSYNYDTEIDILELLGDDPTTMFMTYHWGGRNTSFAVNKGKFNNGACAVKDYSKNFVRMGVDWEPGYIAWYIDGKKCAQVNAGTAQIGNKPMQLILHMMVDNNWQRQWNVGLTDPTLTRQLEVDYIRVYQQH